MKEVLVDANVLLSFLTDRDEGQQKKAAALFRGAADHKHTLALHSVTLMETAYVLVQLYDVEKADVARALGELLALPGVQAIHEVPWTGVFELWPGSIRSLGDAILAAVAKEGRFDSVATFDVPLRKKLAKLGTVGYWSPRTSG